MEKKTHMEGKLGLLCAVRTGCRRRQGHHSFSRETSLRLFSLASFVLQMALFLCAPSDFWSMQSLLLPCPEGPVAGYNASVIPRSQGGPACF